jgi:predicted membrane-bound dolichyl-phosphate-mannose-protein mannosyltransferase
MIILSSAFFLMSAWNLGRTNVPLTTVSFQTSGGKGFHLLLENTERVVSVNVLLKKTTDSISFTVYTGSPETFLCEMKTGVEGCFYVPNIGESVLKIELLFDDEDLVGDQVGGVPPCPTMTTYPDGKVDATDIAFIDKNLGRTEGLKDWDYMADIVPDKSINNMDLESAFNNFDKRGSYINNLTGVTVKFNFGGEKTPDSNGFVAIPWGATSFNVTRDNKPIGAMVTFWKATGISLNGYYCWREISVNAETRRIGFILGPSSGEIAEIIAVGMGNKIIPIGSIKGDGINDEILRNLIDEQDKIEYPPTYMSETYFDEIYYIRTAEEHIKLEKPYETTHPPLGKLIIAAGILVFGYSPFGWRITGVIFATLMIPVIYLLSKELFGTRLAASISAFLLVFEFMHFTMGRIGTVDTYVVFFSLASHLFFFMYLKGFLQNEANKRFLFMAVLFFALGFSTKWIVLYGFIGDVFLLLAFRFRKLLKTETKWSLRIKGIIKYPISPLFDLLVFAMIFYFLTFIPYVLAGYPLIDVFSLQWGMYRYHATLEATHPFASPWWSWPIIQRPVWFYVSYLPNGMVSTISCMGNPAIWWFGISCLIFIAAKIVLKKDFAALYIVTIFLFQWLFYMPISRCIFIYHFYPNVPFLIFSVTCLLNELWRRKSIFGKIIVPAFLIIVVVAFILFYPVLSGQPCLYTWKESLRLFDSWIF